MRARVGLVAVAAFVLAGCGGSSTSSSSPSTTASSTTQPTARLIQLSSPAFASGGTIPRQYTCDGTDVSLPLRWVGVPPGARALMLEMRDPDAPGGSFIHWSLSAIPPTLSGLSPGHVPAGIVQGRNSFGSVGYRGPCPPMGDPPHHYVITLSARGSSGGLVATGTLTGTYARR